MTPGVHRVRRQSWRVGVRSADDAFAARARLRADVEHDLRHALERAFDRVAPDEAVVHLPRLELRLRVASLDALAAAFEEAIERELRLQPPAPPDEPALERLQVLLEYLDTGALAWHAAHGEPAALSSSLKLLLVENLESVARRGPAAGASLTQAMQFYFRLLELLPEEKWPRLAASASPALRQALDVPAATALIVRALQTGVDTSAEALPEELQALAHSPNAALAALAALRPSLQYRAHKLAALVLAAQGRTDSLAKARQAAVGDMDLAEESRAPGVRRKKAESPEPHRTQHQPVTAQSVPAWARRDSIAPTTFAVMAGNAGLVLLHPFIPQLFEACGLSSKHSLREPERAAALLHWLASGREEVHEFELGFVKLLLGLRPETPLQMGEGLLGALEREEGEALLSAVIGHWKALRGTSIDGLRVSFLQRRGALRDDEMGWRLQLEPEAFDVLLGHLPWGFATVKLPWMTRPLYTDWPTP